MSLQLLYWQHFFGCETCQYLITGIPQKCASCHFEILVNFGQVFALFLGAFIYALNILCLLLMLLNATLRHIFVKHQIDVIFRAIIKNISSSHENVRNVINEI